MIKKIYGMFFINDEFFVFPIIEKIKTNKDYKRLFSNFVSLSVLQAVNYILPLITFPYLVRILGVEKFGLLAFAQAFIQYFVIITDYGFNLSATREVSINRDNKEKLNEIFSSVMIIKFALMMVSLILMSVIVFGFEKFRGEWFLYYITFGMVLGQTLFPVWFFQGMEQMKWITYLNIVGKGIFTVAIFICVKTSSDYWKVSLLNSIGFITAGIISLWLVMKKFNTKFIFYGFDTIKQYFKDSTQFFLSRVSVSIYTSSNSFVLGVFTNNIMVGYYRIAEKLYQAIQYIYMPLAQVLYPYISKSRNINLFKKIFKFVILFNLLAVIILFFYSKEFFVLLFSNVSVESIKVFKIFLMVILVVVPSILIGYPVLAALGYPEYANKSVIYGSLFHLSGLILLILVNSVSIFKVAFLVFLTEFFVLGYRLNQINRLKNTIFSLHKEVNL